MTVEALFRRKLSSAEEWLTREEAAVVARVSVATIDRARKTGELRSAHVGRGVRIRPSWLEAWIAAGALLGLLGLLFAVVFVLCLVDVVHAGCAALGCG